MTKILTTKLSPTLVPITSPCRVQMAQLVSGATTTASGGEASAPEADVAYNAFENDDVSEGGTDF